MLFETSVEVDYFGHVTFSHSLRLCKVSRERNNRLPHPCRKVLYKNLRELKRILHTTEHVALFVNFISLCIILNIHKKLTCPSSLTYPTSMSLFDIISKGLIFRAAVNDN